MIWLLLWPGQRNTMSIDFQKLADLIVTMDKHPTGSALFVVGLFLCVAAAVALAWSRKSA